MTNHKKPKRLKQKFYTAKGKEPLKAVSSDLLIQQSETSKSIKNYNTAGIDYDKRIYNKLVRNMEAQKVASQSNDADLKIKLKNYGDSLRNELKKSVGKTRVTIPQNVQATPIYRPQSHQLNDNFIQPARDRQHQTESLTGDAVTVVATSVEDATVIIKDLLKANQYDNKEPTKNTVNRWSKKYGLSKGQIKTIVANDKIEKLENITKLNKATSSSIESKPKPEKPPISQQAKNKIIREKIKNIPINENIVKSVKKRMVDSKLFTENGITIEDLNKVIIARRKKK
jgi:hypothetical protein